VCDLELINITKLKLNTKKCSWQVKKDDMSKPKESHKPKRKGDIGEYKI